MQGTIPQYLSKASRVDPETWAKFSQDSRPSGKLVTMRQVQGQAKSIPQAGSGSAISRQVHDQAKVRNKGVHRCAHLLLNWKPAPLQQNPREEQAPWVELK